MKLDTTEVFIPWLFPFTEKNIKTSAIVYSMDTFHNILNDGYIQALLEENVFYIKPYKYIRSERFMYNPNLCSVDLSAAWAKAKSINEKGVTIDILERASGRILIELMDDYGRDNIYITGKYLTRSHQDQTLSKKNPRLFALYLVYRSEDGKILKEL